MAHTSDIRVLGYEPLLAPAALLAELPLGAPEAKHVEQSRAEVRAVLAGIDDRLLVVAGPCSVHDPAAALDYAGRLAALARSDALTGAPNRRTWDHELSRACQASREDETPLSVAVLDLDRFKSYNDQYGHQAGDRLLREAVAAWSEALGGEGILARYGGEEFAVLLPGLALTVAMTELATRNLIAGTARLRSTTPMLGACCRTSTSRSPLAYGSGRSSTA